MHFFPCKDPPDIKKNIYMHVSSFNPDRHVLLLDKNGKKENNIWDYKEIKTMYERIKYS